MLSDFLGYAHQAIDVVAFNFFKFVLDVADGVLQIGHDDTFEDVDSAYGSLELSGHEVGLFFLLGEFEYAVDDLFHGPE